MKRVFLLAAALITVILCSAQTEVPAEYFQKLDAEQQKEVTQVVQYFETYQELYRDQFDFFLDAIPLPLLKGTIVQGDTWPRQYLEVVGNEARMNALLQGRNVAPMVGALMDTGEPNNWSELERYFWPGWVTPVYTGESSPKDGHSHATHIAGEYVFYDGSRDIGTYISGAKQGKFYLAPYKICTNGGGCNFSWMAQAINDHTDWYEAELKPAGVRSFITLSIGGRNPSSQVSRAIERAYKAGILIFASSGNSSSPEPSYPSSDENAVCLGAHDQNGNIPSWSNWSTDGKLIGVGPGASIISTCADGELCIMSGTSMGSPGFNWAVAFIASLKPEWGVDQCVNFVADNCTPLGPEKYNERSGYGTPKMGKILDALEKGEEPDEPTCSDGMRNGDEKGIDCGGSCPPCEEEGDCVVREERVVTKSFVGKWQMAWKEMNTGNMNIGGTFSDNEQWACIYPSVNFRGDQKISITRMDFEITSDYRAPCLFDEIESHLDKFFRSRGLGLQPGSDFTDAGKWSAFFLDMYLTENDFPVKVRRIEYLGSRSEAYWVYDQIPTWPRSERQSIKKSTSEWEVQVYWAQLDKVGGGGFPEFTIIDNMISVVVDEFDGPPTLPQLSDIGKPLGLIPLEILRSKQLSKSINH